MKDHARTDIHKAAHGETIARASFLSETEAHGTPTLDKSVPEGLYTLERTLSGEIPAELHPMERTYIRELHEVLCPVSRDHCEADGVALVKCHTLEQNLSPSLLNDTEFANPSPRQYCF